MALLADPPIHTRREQVRRCASDDDVGVVVLMKKQWEDGLSSSRIKLLW